MSPTSSVPFMNMSTLIQLVRNPSSFCQVTNNSFPPSSWRVSRPCTRSFQFRHLFSCDLQFVAHLLWALCVHTSSCLFTISDREAVFTSPFLKRKPRDAESCKMSCLERRLSVGDSERISVKSGSVKPSQQDGRLPSFLLCPQSLSKCEPNASS